MFLEQLYRLDTMFLPVPLYLSVSQVKSLQAIHVTPVIESIEQQHRIVAVNV